MTRKSPLLAVLPLLLLLVAGACGSDDDPTVGGSGTEHNEADVEFARGMIPHHEQAIEMSDIVLRRGAGAEVKPLAEGIKAAQAPEIEKMRGWLKAWGEDEKAGGHSGGHGGGHGGSDSSGGEGMLSDEEMREFEKLSGPAADRAFLEMMVRHHEGAIAMARTEVDKGAYPEAKALAQQIIDTQRAEIDRMKQLLAKADSGRVT